MPKSGVYVANTSFASDIFEGAKDDDGNAVATRYMALVGKKYMASFPLVKLYPEHFDSDDGSSVRIEAATAAPGELRGA